MAHCAAGELSLDSDEASPLAGSPQEADEFEVTDADLDFSLLSPRDAATKRFTSPGCDMTFRRHALLALSFAVNLQCVVFTVTELGHRTISQLLLHLCKGIATGCPCMVCRRRSIAEESRAPSLQVTPAASPVRSTRGIAGLWGFTTPKKRR